MIRVDNLPLDLSSTVNRHHQPCPGPRRPSRDSPDSCEYYCTCEYYPLLSIPAMSTPAISSIIPLLQCPPLQFRPLLSTPVISVNPCKSVCCPVVEPRCYPSHLRTSSRELEATTGAATHNLDEELHDDLSSLDLGIHKARDLAQNRPLWRLVSLHSAMHS